MVAMCGCESNFCDTHWIITNKYTRSNEKPICDFHYHAGCEAEQFQDTCSKYNVGDTIKH